MAGIIRGILENILSRNEASDSLADEHALRVVAATLLLEVARADLDVDDAERATILSSLTLMLDMDETEADLMFRRADKKGRSVPSYYESTSVINERFPLEHKIRLVELMWEVAFSDHILDKHEEHLIRRIAGLLHVPHRDFVDAKLRAREKRVPKNEGKSSDPWDVLPG